MPASTGFIPVNRIALKAREKIEKFKIPGVSKKWKKTPKLLTTTEKDYNKACLKTNILTSSVIHSNLTEEHIWDIHTIAFEA